MDSLYSIIQDGLILLEEVLLFNSYELKNVVLTKLTQISLGQHYITGRTLHNNSVHRGTWPCLLSGFLWGLFKQDYCN